jgi:hypothetical protein
MPYSKALKRLDPMFRNYLMNKMLLRNVGLIYGEINNYPKEPGHFTPYFQYQIGPYADDFILYFPKLPNAVLYYNSIFLKLWAYNPQDAIKYIEAHFTLYSDKHDFLLFLKRQLQHRMAQFKKRSSKRSISAISLDWVTEKLAEWKDEQKIAAYNQFIRQDLTVIVKNELQHALPVNDAIPQQSLDQIADQITQILEAKTTSILENMENKIMQLADKYEVGSIELTNQEKKEKLVALLLTLRSLTGKPNRRNKMGEPLFSRMDLNDIAQIFRLHFMPWKGQKIDSVEKRIYAVNASYKSDDPDLQELSKALQKFFFEN